jgi:hypothetical protein
MASSTLSSVIGKPFNAGSCFGFLSFPGMGVAVAAAAGNGKSRPSVNTHAKESTMETIDLAEIENKEDAGRG